MRVKNEPDYSFDIQIATDIETSAFKEELFGNAILQSNSTSDASETNSDDDLTSAFNNYDASQPMETFSMPSWCSNSCSPSSSSSSGGAEYDIMNELSMGDFPPDLLTGIIPSVVKEEEVGMDVDVEVNKTDGASNFIDSLFPMKEEPNSPVIVQQNYPSPEHSHNIWDLLNECDNKTNFKVPDTPPITPPQVEYSPPQSPLPKSFSALVVPTMSNSNTSSVNLQPHKVIVTTATTNSTSSAVYLKQENPITPSMKVVTISTNTGQQTAKKSGRVSKTQKIQPKVMTASQPQIISIVNPASTTKLAIPKINNIKTEPVSNGIISSIKTTTPQISSKTISAKSPSVQSSKIVTLKPSAITTMMSSNSLHSSNKTSPITNNFIAAAKPTMHSTITAPQVVNASSVITPVQKYTPLAPALSPVKQDHHDLKAYKRQQRMIKNRESASLSRKKKKEYVSSLEGRINDIVMENNALKDENNILKQRIEALEQECTNLKKFHVTPNKKSGTILLAVLFVFSLGTFGPIGSVLPGSDSGLLKVSSSITSEHANKGLFSPSLKSRSLLWLDTGAPTSPLVSPIGNISYTCPVYINATESLRLESSLRDWFEPSKKSKQDAQPTKQSKLLRFHPKTKEGRKKAVDRDLSNLKKYEINDLITPNKQPKDAVTVKKALTSSSQLSALPSSLYPNIYGDIKVQPSMSESKDTSVVSVGVRMQSFLEAIHRRDDTYYVVSFSPDHLLVPATTHNATARPRMSLLLPTPRSLNGSVSAPPFHVSMMQIDCEVTDTHLVYISEDKVPVHLRPVQPASHPRNNSNTSQNSESNHRSSHKSRRARAKPIPSLLDLDTV